MFESKIQSIIPTDGTLEIETNFINNVRRFQICNVIDSLTEEEFISLQKSIMESFKAVEELMDAVKDGMKKLQFYNQTLYDLNDTYCNSTEGSFYYRNKYLELLRFLSANSYTFDQAAEEDNFESLLLDFHERFEEPFDLMKTSILQALFTREELKNRINQGADFRDVKQMEKSNHLCEEIRKVLLENAIEPVRKEIERAPASLIDTALVQHISILGDCLEESKDEGRDSITSILDEAKEKLNIRHSMDAQLQDLINQFSRKQFLWISLSSHDDALDSLLKELKKKSGDFFEADIYFLQQLKESSDWKRRKFYSGRKFQCPGMKNPNNYYGQDMDLFKIHIENSSMLYYNQYVSEIRQEEICAINKVFQEMLRHNPGGNQNIKLYQDSESKYVYQKSVDDVMKDINDRYKYEALKSIFRSFFERLLTGDIREEMRTKFDREEDSVDSQVQKIMDSVAELVWNEQKGHLVINPNQTLLNLYHNIENMRRVQEDEVIDAIISDPVYQKK